MKKIYLTSALSFLLVSQPSIHALNPKNIIDISYKFLFGGLNLNPNNKKIYFWYCYVSFFPYHILKELYQERQNKQKNVSINRVAPQEKKISSNQTKHSLEEYPYKEVPQKIKTLENKTLPLFEDPYNAPTQEEWDEWNKKKETI